MRLIDAYALQNEIHKSKMQNPHTDPKIARNHEFEHDHFMQMVVLQPTAQEEIVRCKDCEHSCAKGHGLYYQFIECEKTGTFHKEDWFCAAGERYYFK